MPTWHKLKLFGKKEPSNEKMAHYFGLWTSLYLCMNYIDVGGSTSLWSVSPFHRWAWVYKKLSLSKPWIASQ